MIWGVQVTKKPSARSPRLAGVPINSGRTPPGILAGQVAPEIALKLPGPGEKGVHCLLLHFIFGSPDFPRVILKGFPRLRIFQFHD